MDVVGIGTSNNRVIGNHVGLDINGVADLGNTLVGVAVGQGATANIIGEPGGGNVISGNDQYGVRIVDPDTNNNLVQSNHIGLDITGSLARGNTSDGVRLEASGAATGNVVGGAAAGIRNVISGNGGSGIQVRDFVTGTLIAGNVIGLNSAGTAGLGNGQHGVHIAAGSAGNTIGGPSANERNVLSGNGGQGVRIDGLNTNNNLVAGNRIGTNTAGTAGIGNAAGGIAITNQAANNTIGGPSGGNRIAFNTTDGVNVATGAGTGNAILGNAIHGNTALGIDLSNDGVTSNDANDIDTGPNDLLNFPLITSAFASGGVLTVNFRLDVPAGSYRIEMFKNPSGADPSTFGEGEVFASTANVINHPGGDLFYNQSFAGIANDVITATTTACTDGTTCAAFGSTSEFSKAMLAVTTAVELMSFTALGRDGAVDLSWTTGSELANLGFHLYRSGSASGPYHRITPSLIPGLGSSPLGRSIQLPRRGPDQRHSLLLQARGRRHLGRDRAATVPSPPFPRVARPATTPPGGPPIRSGWPTAILPRSPFGCSSGMPSHALLELRTGGFYATPNDDGSVDLSIPSFEDNARPGQPKVPTRRVWISAVVGRRAQITSVQAEDAVSFEDLRPAPAAAPVVEALQDGMVRPGRSRRPEDASFRRGPFPRVAARVRGTAFQGETKKAELDLAPLRFVPATGRLVLSRRLLVRVDFVGSEAGETSLGGARGRRPPLPGVRSSTSPLVQLVVGDKGLYRVAFEAVSPGAARPFASSLSLSRKGEPVAFFVDRRPSVRGLPSIS